LAVVWVAIRSISLSGQVDRNADRLQAFYWDAGFEVLLPPVLTLAAGLAIVWIWRGLHQRWTTPALKTVRRFYRERRHAQNDRLRSVLADDVTWSGPDGGTDPGEIHGAEAVIQMVRRLQETTAGTIRFRLIGAAEVNGRCAVGVAWSARELGTRIRGRNLAVFTVRDDKISAVQAWSE
jgi:ketosteroid isomerase-like protein